MSLMFSMNEMKQRRQFTGEEDYLDEDGVGSDEDGGFMEMAGTPPVFFFFLEGEGLV
jgi:hypothetical protein